MIAVQDFAKLDDVATDEELDMLDLAYGLTDTSRLGCQVHTGNWYRRKPLVPGTGYVSLGHYQCCGSATFLGGSGSGS